MKFSISIGFLLLSLLVVGQGKITKKAAKKECSLVSITVESAKGDLKANGVIIDDGGYILTTAKVIRTADNIVITYQDGSFGFADVYSAYNLSDVALVKVPELPTRTCASKLGNSDLLKADDPAIVLLDNPEEYAVGEKVAQESEITHHPLIEYFELKNTNVDLVQGTAVFDRRGQVIGVVSDTLTHGENQAVVSSNLAVRVLEDEHAFWVGIENRLVHQSEVSSLPQPVGLEIVEMSPKSPFALDGFEVGDIILEIGDIIVDEVNDLEEIYRYLRHEDGIVGLIVFRHGRVLPLELDLNDD